MERQRFKIALADATGLGLEIESTFFRRRGFTVQAAPDGPTALELIASDRPDVAILNQTMPGLSGSEVCSRLRASKDTQAVPVVVVGPTDGEEIRGVCKACGADAFVPRSAGREALLDVVARLLRIPPRRTARITVLFSVYGGDGRERLGRAVELSEAGMHLEVDRPCEEGSSLSLRFRLPGEPRDIKAWSVVRWTRRGEKGAHSIGLEFVALPVHARRSLNDYIDTSLSPS